MRAGTSELLSHSSFVASDAGALDNLLTSLLTRPTCLSQLFASCSGLGRRSTLAKFLFVCTFSCEDTRPRALVLSRQPLTRALLLWSLCPLFSVRLRPICHLV